MKRFSSGYFLPLLSGILVGFSYIPFPPVLMFLCFMPLWAFWLENPKPWKVFLAGWITQFVFTFIGFHWIYHTAQTFGHLHPVLAATALLGFCCFGSIHLPISGWVWAKIQQKVALNKWQSLAVIVLSFAVVESFVPQIFPWTIGYCWLWGQLPGYQWADTIGFQGLTFITLAINAALLYLWQDRQNKKNLILGMSAIAVLVIAMNVSGYFYGQQWQTPNGEIKILAVQPNIGNDEKVQADLGEEVEREEITQYILDKTLEITEKGLKEHPDVDLVIWPESAFPHILQPQFLSYFESKGIHYQRKLRNFIKKNQKPMIIGALAVKPPNTYYNAMYFIDKQGRDIQEEYHKTMLLMFGEYLPEPLAFIRKFAPMIGSFGRGSGAIAIEISSVKVGPQICYEGLHPAFVSQQSAVGAEIFINLTNDSWFDTRMEPYQHLYMTLARAIEFRRPLVRVTNTGITTAILADGTLQQSSPLHEEWVGKFTIPYQKDPAHTTFETIGKFFPYFFLVLLIVLVSFAYKEAKHDTSD